MGPKLRCPSPRCRKPVFITTDGKIWIHNEPLPPGRLPTPCDAGGMTPQEATKRFGATKE